MNHPWGHARPYNDFASYLRRYFGGRVQKLSINAGFTCPNRDGSKGSGGCTFCNNETFKPAYCEPASGVREQLETGKAFFSTRYPDARYLAYFQAYTNTYADLAYLKDLYGQALEVEGVVGLVVGTRPDCLPDALLDYFADLQKAYYVTVELGVESTNDATLKRVNRGHDYASTCDAVARLRARNLPVGAHLILGLPGEDRDQMLAHATTISRLDISYLKVHQLQYVKGSQLGRQFMARPQDFEVLKLDDYVDLVCDFVALLRPDIVLERFASQAPHDLLLAPRWGLKNFELVHRVEQRLVERKLWQGKHYTAF